MIAATVTTEEQIQSRLRQQGFEPTNVVMGTGTFWRHGTTKRHLLVPNAWDGFYPDWMIKDIDKRIEILRDWSGRRRLF